MIELTREQGRIRIRLKAIQMGKDLCVTITGGDRPHLGAVALSAVRPSLDDPNKLSASTSVLTLLGHKEDEVARKVAHILSSRLGINVVVCCGIHVDEITSKEIAIVSDLVDKITEDLINS